MAIYHGIIYRRLAQNATSCPRVNANARRSWVACYVSDAMRIMFSPERTPQSPRIVGGSCFLALRKSCLMNLGAELATWSTRSGFAKPPPWGVGTSRPFSLGGVPTATIRRWHSQQSIPPRSIFSLQPNARLILLLVWSRTYLGHRTIPRLTVYPSRLACFLVVCPIGQHGG